MDASQSLSPALSAWLSAGKFFYYKGFRLFYRVEGEGKPLLCLHGFPSSSHDWAPLWAALSPHFKLIAPDFLGLGFSDKPRTYAYSIVDQASICIELLNRLGVGEAHLLAHDYGDSVAQELMARNQEEDGPGVRSACFLNGGMFPEAHRPRLIQKLLAGPLGSMIAGHMSAPRFARSFAAVFGEATQPTEEQMQDFWSVLSYNDGTAAMPALLQYMRERRRMRSRWVGAVQEARIPMLLVNGSSDPVSGSRMADAMDRLVPGCAIYRLQGIGHYPQVEAPTQVCHAYLSFLEQHGIINPQPTLG